jgi:hypothetical protein
VPTQFLPCHSIEVFLNGFGGSFGRRVILGGCYILRPQVAVALGRLSVTPLARIHPSPARNVALGSSECEDQGPSQSPA